MAHINPKPYLLIHNFERPFKHLLAKLSSAGAGGGHAEGGKKHSSDWGLGFRVWGLGFRL